jgi:hypothetical protein
MENDRNFLLEKFRGHEIWLRRLAYLVALGILIIACFYVLYPKAIYGLYGRDIPPKWSSDFTSMTFAQINQALGHPQDDASAKGFQNWVEFHWWGQKILKMTADDFYKPGARPEGIYYIVYVDGWYHPAFQKKLNDGSP